MHPGADETCDAVDEDCDGVPDDVDSWADGDGDGFRDASMPSVGCPLPAGNVANDLDCDDASAIANPAATELCNAVDDDCDGLVDEPDAADAVTWYADADADGFGDPISVPVVACDAPPGHVADLIDS